MFLYRVALAHLGKGKLELPCNPGAGAPALNSSYTVIAEGEGGSIETQRYIYRLIN